MTLAQPLKQIELTMRAELQNTFLDFHLKVFVGLWVVAEAVGVRKKLQNQFAVQILF